MHKQIYVRILHKVKLVRQIRMYALLFTKWVIMWYRTHTDNTHTHTQTNTTRFVLVSLPVRTRKKHLARWTPQNVTESNPSSNQSHQCTRSGVEGYKLAHYVEDWGDSLQCTLQSRRHLPSATWWGNPSVVALPRAAANVSVGSATKLCIICSGYSYRLY